MQDFKPNYKKHFYPISTDGLEFLRDLSSNSDYDGYISLSLRDDARFKPICFVRLSNLVKFVSHMEIYPQKHYYLSATSFRKIERSHDSTYAYNAIVIDVDCHADSVTDQERESLIDSFVWRLNNDCIQCGDLISPNYIVLTGRGVQLWWFINPVYAPKFTNCILDVTNHFISIIQTLIDEFQSELIGMEVDVPASTNLIGLYRLPGSSNPTTGKKVQTHHLSDERLDLVTYRKAHLPYTREKEKAFGRMKHIAISQNQKERCEQLLDAVQKLRNLRSAPSGNELRNNFIFLFFALARSIYSADEAMRRTEDFNEGFRVPFSPRELKSTLSSAIKKTYAIGTQKIIDLLSVTDEEAKLVGLMSPNIHIGAPKNNEKAERDTNILKMHLAGANQKIIAEYMGITRQTVSTALKAQHADELLMAKTKLLCDSGVTAREIAQQMGCSQRTIAYRLASAKTMEPSDFAKYAKMLKSCLYNGLTLSPTPQQVERGKTAQPKDAVADHLEALVLRCLKYAAHSEGSLCLPESVLIERVAAIRKRAKHDEIAAACKALTQKGIIKYATDADGTQYLYLRQNFELETAIAKRSLAIIKSEKEPAISESEIRQSLSSYEFEKQMMFSEEQKTAVVTAITSPLSVITGGPGTGKTAVTDAICALISEYNPTAKIRLCAPTGKAAVHLAETTGHPATTIHRLLSAHSVKCDYLIVDEMSMVSAELFADLIAKVTPTVRLIMIGDPNQLPCIGSGNILQDLISSQYVPTVTLKTCFRQCETSGIIKFATSIVDQTDPGMVESIIRNSLMNDIYFQVTDDMDDLVLTVSNIISDLMNCHSISASEIQILSPTKNCASELNIGLRHLLNCSANGQAQVKEDILLPGDRVIYCKNDYVRNLFNGAEGIVKGTGSQYVTVEYADHHVVRHDIGEVTAKMLVLSYALTIHKAQGSEYPIAIIPIYESMDNILNQNLIYTAITRAKQKCVLIGSKAALVRAIQRSLKGIHYSRLVALLTQNLTST